MTDYETDLIRITVELKNWLDKQKLVPTETYDHLLNRLLSPHDKGEGVGKL